MQIIYSTPKSRFPYGLIQNPLLCKNKEINSNNTKQNNDPTLQK